jgi:diadenylate cyclase
LSIFNTFSWRDAVDILVVAYLIYTVINLLIHTRTGLLIKGAVVLLVAYFLATNLQLRTIKFLIDYLFRYGLVVLVVIFQPELRTVLEKIGRTELGRSLFISRLGSTEQDSQKQAIDIITTAAERLSSTNTGALIVFEKETPLTDIISTGTTIDAEVSEELIGNIFYKGAPLHDGAVVIRKDRIVAAACLLPVSHNLEISRDMGTRHRAALGISENSDAVVLVVSEENGFISIAQNGSIVRQLDKNRAYQMLTDELCPERQDGSDQLPWYKRILGNAKVSKQ